MDASVYAARDQEVCICTHPKRLHRAERHGKQIIYACVHFSGACVPCKCRNFVPAAAASTTGGAAAVQEDEMPKKREKKPKAAKKERKPKTEGGRKPTLAPFIDAPFTIHAEYKEKKFKAEVQADGTISLDGQTFTSPSSAGRHALNGKSVDGWTFWRFEQEGKLVPLDELRGKKSPIAKEPAA